MDKKKNKKLPAAAIQTAQPVAPIKPVEQRDFYNVPDSPATNLIMEALGAGTAIADLPARKKQVNHTAKLKTYDYGQRRQIELKNQKDSITIELADIDKLTGSNKPAKKLFVLALIKANEQAIHEGQLTRNYVSFPLQDLIDKGFYSTPQSARKGFNAGMDTLTSLKIKGHIQKTEKQGSTIDALEVLFTGARIERGQCIIFFNDRISWSFIVQYFTILPPYYFRLSNRASDLLFYIFYLARQHTAPKDIVEIEDEETKTKKPAVVFNISFRAIQHRLWLPSEVENARPKQTIKDPIDEAIAQIEAEHSKTYGNIEFSLLPVYDETASIADFLDNGYLRVTLTGDFAQTFIQRSQETAKQIQQAEKRKERIREKAIAIKTAAAMEAQENTEGSESNAKSGQASSESKSRDRSSTTA